MPCVRTKQEGNSAILNFDTLDQQAAHTVLVDSDPNYYDHFEALNREERGKVLALNSEADQAIKEQTTRISFRFSKPCGGLRIDHHMIPDVEKLLRLIGTVIDSNADLIFTIGAFVDVYIQHSLSYEV